MMGLLGRWVSLIAIGALAEPVYRPSSATPLTTTWGAGLSTVKRRTCTSETLPALSVARTDAACAAAGRAPTARVRLPVGGGGVRVPRGRRSSQLGRARA